MNADIRSINKLSWHLDFRQAETEIVKNKDCATKVVKLLKYFRNCNPPFHAIFKSYFLRTLVMTIMIKNYPFRSWQEYDLCKNFLDALTKLREMCKIVSSRYQTEIFTYTGQILRDKWNLRVNHFGEFVKKQQCQKATRVCMQTELFFR